MNLNVVVGFPQQIFQINIILVDGIEEHAHSELLTFNQM